MKLKKSGNLLFKDLSVGWELNCGKFTVKAEAMEKFTSLSTQNKLQCTWCGHKKLGENFTVKVIWQKLKERVRGRISYSKANGKYTIEEIIFPVAEFPVRKNADWLIPLSQGTLISNVDQAVPGEVNSAAFRAFQFCALLADDQSLYFDTHDVEFNIKYGKLEMKPDQQEMVYRGVYPLPQTRRSRRNGRQPYTSDIAAFNGSWYEAAQIYRKWACRQRWVQTRHNPLRDIAMWFWNRGSVNEVIPPVEEFTADTNLPAALDWYWWHHNPYDADYPDFWPPREGEEKFKAAISRLNEKNIFSQVYINGMAWDVEAQSWPEGGADSIIIRRDGTQFAVEYNIYNHRRLGLMCGEAPAFQKHIRKLAEKLRSCGLPGLYLDMIACGSYAHRCINPAHKHAPGGGNFGYRGYRSLLEEIKQNNPGMLLSSEECSEAYLDLLDSLIVLTPSSERLNRREPVVPVFSAIYHGSIALFGNYALPDGLPPFDPMWPGAGRWNNEKTWHELYPEQFFVEMARGVIWGMQPTVANFRTEHIEKPEFSEAYKFLKATAEFYYDNRDWLFDGKMLHPGELKCKSRTVKFVSRMIFTRENEENEMLTEMPSVLHSRWQSPSGQRALIMCNYTDEPQEIYDSVSGVRRMISPRSWAIIN